MYDRAEANSNKLEESLLLLEQWKRRGDDLLYSMLPRQVAEHLRQGKDPITTCQTFEEVSVLFAETTFVDEKENLPALDIVRSVNNTFSLLDGITEKYHVFKVETVGGVYMVVGGAPERNPDHCAQVAALSLHMVKAIMSQEPCTHTIRIGVHVGPVVAGVVGNKLPRYCLFGDTVNTAARMLTNGCFGKVHITERCAKKLEIFGFKTSYRGNFFIKEIMVGEFTWNEKTQGFILGSFYYSYGLANVIGGPSADYFGGRMLIGVATLANAILTILTPMASRLGVGFLIAIRVLEGCFQGVIFPSLNKLITRWFTTEERSKFTGIIFPGMDLGCVLTFSISGYLCNSEFLGGWPSVFYVFGFTSVIWSFFWFSLIRDEPRKHPRISEEELKYILDGSPNTELKNPVPWSSILGSKSLWATVIAHTGQNFGYFILLSELPTYFADILHIPINNNGLLTAIPYLATWVFSVIYSIAVDKAITSGFMTILSVRRLSVAISGYGFMLCLIGMCFVNCNISGAFAVLLVSGTLAGAGYCGIFSSYSDLSPKFAGTLIGLGTAFGGIAGFVGPAVTGIVTEGNQSIPAWRIVFIMCAIISGITATIYELFITTEIQPWNEPRRN